MKLYCKGNVMTSFCVLKECDLKRTNNLPFNLPMMLKLKKNFSQGGQ